MRLILFFLKKIRWPLRKLLFYRKRKVVLFIVTDFFFPPRADIILIPYNKLIAPFLKKCKTTNRIFLHCNCNKIPLADNSIDFIILSSALEFCSNHKVLLSELSRIGKAGYIESASALLDRFYPHPSRVLEVLKDENGLVINKKTSAVNDIFLSKARLFQANKNWKIIHNLFPYLFFEIFIWENEITYNSFSGEKMEDSNLNEIWTDFMIERQNRSNNPKSIKYLIIEKLNILYSINRRKRLLKANVLTRLN